VTKQRQEWVVMAVMSEVLPIILTPYAVSELNLLKTASISAL